MNFWERALQRSLWGRVLFLLMLWAVGAKGEILALPPVVGEVQVLTTTRRQSLFSLAKKAHMGIYHLRLANALHRSWVRAGTQLVIPKRHVLPKVQEGIVLNVPERRMYLFRHGELVGWFPSAVGRPGMPTPRGLFRVVVKAKNPTWNPPEWAGLEKPVPPGPQNPLGDRWIGISAKGIGFHSTNAPASIGFAVSHGCVRLFPWDARKLFEAVRVGDPVTILNQPLKLGAREGIIYLEAYPPLYGREESRPNALWRKANAAGLAELIDWHRAKAVLREKRGYAVAIGGEKVLVQSVKGEEKSWVLYRKSGTMYGTLDFLRWALQVEELPLSGESEFFVGRENILEVQRPSLQIRVNGEALGKAFQVGPSLYLPVRKVTESLGARLVYSKDGHLTFSSSLSPEPSI